MSNPVSPSLTTPLPEAATVERWREDFPILHRRVYGKPLIYLDNAATAQKPRQVIEALTEFYENRNANVHRGAHALSTEATDCFETARTTVARWIHAASEKEVLWTRGTTEAINLVAQAWGNAFVKAGDLLVATQMEHHANLVPWQMLARRTGAELALVPVRDDGTLDRERYRQLLERRPRLVALAHVSNTLGTINPVAELIAEAKAVGATVLIDGAQAVGHFPVDVQALGCDFYAFSGHKMLGPTGIGVLWGRQEVLEAMPPWQGGGEMIAWVDEHGFEPNELPYKFEAGTPPIAEAIALGAAIDYLRQFDRAQLAAWEAHLYRRLRDGLVAIDGLRLLADLPPEEKAPIASFHVAGTHPADLGTLLDTQGIAVRVGHHCTMPLIARYGLPGTVRASIAFYNNEADIDQTLSALSRALERLGAPAP
ncbi:aminotransferase class V-fold PLP-dependent enzyme [Tepidiphilus sp. HLB4]